MERNIKKITHILLAALLLAPLSALAQDDMGVWMDITGEKKITKQLSVEAEGEFRLRDDASEADRVSLGASIGYKPVKHIKTAAGYTFLYDNIADKVNPRQDGSIKWIRPGYWMGRHRVFASVAGDIDLGRWNLSLRERWQYTYRPTTTATRDYYTRDNEYNYSEEDPRPSQSRHVLRSRFEASYDIRHCPVAPYASIELTNGWEIAKIRYMVGADWKINKQITAGLAYIYQDVRGDDGEDDFNEHVISVSMKYKF